MYDPVSRISMSNIHVPRFHFWPLDSKNIRIVLVNIRPIRQENDPVV
jgi:hypothetical protein